jgi:hypothetical protein
MSELWIGAIASTIAGCIWAAWGPRALLGTMGVLAAVFVWWMHENGQRQYRETISRCFDMPGHRSYEWGSYENPADCRKAGGVPYADWNPGEYARYRSLIR